MIKKVEEFVKNISGKTEPAHNYDHFDRSRHWGVKIAQGEDFHNLELVEIACLMHDVGLTKGRKNHGETGAIIAEKFLKNEDYNDENIKEITHAIRYHDSNRKGEKTKLLDIVRDSDMLELFGPIGIMRAAASTHHLPISDVTGQGQYKNFSAFDFDKLFDAKKVNWQSTVDVINFQNSCFDNLNTVTAKKIAEPWLEVSKNFLEQFENQFNSIINHE